MGAACHSIQLSSYKHHSLAPHRTAPHASPLRACRQHHELLPREPLHAPAPSPEPRARAQDTARSSRPRSPASRRHAALPRNCSPPPPSTSCPGPSNRLRRHVAKGGLAALRGLREEGGAGFLSGGAGRMQLFPFPFSPLLSCHPFGCFICQIISPSSCTRTFRMTSAVLSCSFSRLLRHFYQLPDLRSVLDSFPSSW